MDRWRRKWLQAGGRATLLGLLAATGWLKPGNAQAQAWNGAAFETHSVADALKALAAGRAGAEQGHRFSANAGHRRKRRGRSDRRDQRHREDGVDRDPDREKSQHAGRDLRYSLRHRADDLDARQDGANLEYLRAGKADGKYYVAGKEIKVTLGGCGG